MRGRWVLETTGSGVWKAGCVVLGLMMTAACRENRTGNRPTGVEVPRPMLAAQRSGTDVLLQSVSAVDSLVVWVGGHGATFVRTIDGGRTWQPGVVSGPDTLQFRDVHAVSADTAYLLSAGPGDMSRIYKTSDGGMSWELQFTNQEPRAFFDCMDFWGSSHGIAMSDAVDGRLVLITTADGGRNWTRVAPTSLPVALDGEGAFAASGTCVETRPPGYAWIGTGAGGAARVFRTDDRGATWSVFDTPIVSGTATSGITTLAFHDEHRGLALGGELSSPDAFADNVAVTDDGGRTWTLGGRPSFSGAVYGSALVPGSEGPIVVAVGPKGASYTLDRGTTWLRLDTLNYWSVDFAGPNAGWAVGPNGRITRVGFAK